MGTKTFGGKKKKGSGRSKCFCQESLGKVSPSISHLAVALMPAQIVMIGDTQIIRRLFFVFKFFKKYELLLAGDFEMSCRNI